MAKQNKGRKFFAASATAALVASAIVPVASAAQVNDYNKISGYAKEAVQSLVDAGVIQGDTNGNFNPLNTVTRAQAAEIFTKALELEADGDVNFSDVKKGAWYYNSIAAVVANGIFEGVSANEFAPNKSLTRSEAAKVLVDAFGLEGSESLSQFADASQVKGWAKSALETAVANGIFTGSEENGKLNLKPNAAITRQDFAVVFARTLDLVDTETPVDASIKAINNTTVEVTFDEEQDTDNVKADDFKIDGLEIKNASVKQTNKKVVVLTTEAQTADKEYVVSLKGEELGKFKGIAAVIPTKVDIVEKSVQGVLGQQVTVQAKVTVAEGQSVENIPVTFYVNESATGLNKAITAEALTNKDGVATYSYTRYVGADDSVTAYSTGDRSKFSNAVVYWGAKQRLTLTSATGETVNNGEAKTYTATYLDVNGNPIANAVLDITLAENIDADVTNDSSATLTDPTTNAITKPYESASNQNTLEIKTNSKGEATFTVSGSNAKSTPIVFVDNSPANNRLGATELQVKAPQASFVGGQYSFEFNHETTVEGVKGLAKKYTVTVKKADGKVYAGGTATVDLWEDIDGVLATTTDATLSNTSATSGFSKGYKTLQLDKDGKASFWVKSDSANVSATPVVWVDINNASNVQGKLEAEEAHKKAGSVVFREEQLASAKLEDTTENQYGAYVVNGTAKYRVQLLNQNGTVTTDPNTGIERVTYTLKNTGNSPLTVNLAATDFTIDSVTNTSGPTTGNGTHTIAAGNSITVTGVTAVTNKRDKNVFLDVTTTGLASQNVGSLEVVASATYNQFTNAGAISSTGHYAAGTTNTSWVNATAASVNEEITGKVVGFNTSDSATNHGTVVVLTDAGAYRSFTYALTNNAATTDQFFVGTDGSFTHLTGTTISDFENKLSVDDRISRVANGAVNQVRLLNVDGKTNDQATANTAIGSVADTTAPTLNKAEVQANGTVKLTFSEAVTNVTAADYFFVNASGATVTTTALTTAENPVAGASAVWTLTPAAAIGASTHVEYREISGAAALTQDPTGNKLVAGSKVSITPMASFTVTQGAKVAGTNGTLGVNQFEGSAFTAGVGETVTLTLAATSGATEVINYTTSATTAADALAEIATAITSSTTSKFTATINSGRLVVTQKVGSAANTDDVATVTLANAGGASTFALTATPVAGTKVPGVAATALSQTVTVQGNTSGSNVTKNVTITVAGTAYTQSVQFLTGDNTAAAAAARIAGVFNGVIPGYNVTVVGSDVVITKATTGTANDTITLTIN